MKGKSINVSRVIVSVCLIGVGLLASAAHADVLNMGGTRNADGTWMGLASLETVTVGDPGNAGTISGGAWQHANPLPTRMCGSVPYTYNIGKYEVTAGQYTEFLNAVASTDTYGLYNTRMADPTPAPAGYPGSGCNIQRSGSSGHYTYSVDSGWANRPVNYVSFWDSCRFANWLQNGQPSGEQSAGTTETGTYTLDGYNGNDGTWIHRNANVRWAVASEDEWYKAAFYDPHKPGGAGYWGFATGGSEFIGVGLSSLPTAEPPPGGTNSVNYLSAVGGTTEVGAYTASTSAYGTFDQNGNVGEWTEALVYNLDSSPPYWFRGLRGGGFNQSEWYLYSGELLYSTPTWERSNVGFRVSDAPDAPEPATLSLFAFASVALIRRRQA